MRYRAGWNNVLHGMGVELKRGASPLASNGRSYDAVVVGSGPNGLGAAIALAAAGQSVLVLEARETVGGGLRSAALTLPGFVHDVCSAIHPLAVTAPFFRSLPLRQYGLNWIHAEFPLAHPLSDARAAVVERSLDATAERLGRDGPAYHRLLAPLVHSFDHLLQDIMGPPRLPRHPFLLARFGRCAVRSASGLAHRWFRDEPARALWSGLAAHSILPLNRTLTSAVGLVLAAAAHTGGWPMPQGGSQQIADALAAHFRSLGGVIVTQRPVRSLRDVPRSRAILFDLTPSQLLEIAGDVLPRRYQRKLTRFRHGPGVFKMDWALSAPIPWEASECRRASTVHVGGTFAEVADAELAPWDGRSAEHPFVLVAQQSLFDPTRAPLGKHTAWGYCHVPHGSTEDMTERIERQIERFAPGFHDVILERHSMTPTDVHRYNENYVGGDITGGVMDLWQSLARPVASLVPYRTPVAHLFLCSSSTPPGPGVHGMCGFHAAQATLRYLRGKNV